MVRLRLVMPDYGAKWIQCDATRRLVVLAVFWAGSAQGQDNQGADQPTGKKDALFIVSEPRTFQASRSYHTVAFSPDGRQLASAGPNKAAIIWNAANEKKILNLLGQQEETYDVAFSPDGKWIAAGARKGAKLWNASTGVEIFSTRGQGWVNRVAFSPDCKRLATAGSPGIKIWDVATGKEICTLPGDRTWESCAVFSPDGTQVASGNISKTVKLWDAANGRELLVFKGHLGPVYTVAFSRDGKRIASASADKTVKIWDARTGAELLTLKGHTAKVNTVAFSPEGRILVSAGGDKTMRLWDADSGRQLLVIQAHNGDVYSAVYSPDGFRLASTGGDGVVKLWAVGVPLGKDVKVSVAELETAWSDLLGDDILKRTRAILILSSVNSQAIPFLKMRLRPADFNPARAKQLAELIAHLSHDSYPVRHKAMQALEKLGRSAEPALRLTLKRELDLEARRRVEQLLHGLQSAAPSPKQLQAELITEVLERIGTSEARAVLFWLAEGAPEAWMTQQAGASLERLDSIRP
jgi:WD40 repeat protein